MLFLQPARLISIAPDAQLFELIRGFCQKNGIADTAIEAHTDGSQWVLPRLAAENRTSDPILDLVLIDGCHGWPTLFVDLEYTNSMLRQGGYLMIDDVNLYVEKEMARLLSEHAAFSLALDLGKSLVHGIKQMVQGGGRVWRECRLSADLVQTNGLGLVLWSAR
jgi:predicted O-methyltransferase YrrM